MVIKVPALQQALLIHICRVGQDRLYLYTVHNRLYGNPSALIYPYFTVYTFVCMVLATPTNMSCKQMHNAHMVTFFMIAGDLIRGGFFFIPGTFKGKARLAANLRSCLGVKDMQICQAGFCLGVVIISNSKSRERRRRKSAD